MIFVLSNEVSLCSGVSKCPVQSSEITTSVFQNVLRESSGRCLLMAPKCRTRVVRNTTWDVERVEGFWNTIKRNYSEEMMFIFLQMNEWCFRPWFGTCKATLGQGQLRRMRWILQWIMPLLKDLSLDMLACSPACYHPSPLCTVRLYWTGTTWTND